MKDDALVSKARTGDPQSLQILYEQNREKVFSIAYSYTKKLQDDEEILQQTFVQALSALKDKTFENLLHF